MASKTFLLLALAFVVVLLISSEVAAANDLTSDHDSELDGRGGYNRGHDRGYYGGGRGGYGKGGSHGKGGGRGGGGRKGCKHGCCGRGRYYGGCKCCSTFEEATAYKQQTQN